MVNVFGDASGHKTCVISMDNITTNKGISVEELQKESNLIMYHWFSTVDDYMPSSSAPIGETGGEVSAICGDSSDIMQGDSSSKSEVQNKLPYLSSLQSDTHSRAVWLMYLLIV